MRNKILNAFKLFHQGIRPEEYGKPKCWYVLDDDLNLYPVKIIWALANNLSNTSKCNTVEVNKQLKKLGFSLLNTKYEDNFQDEVSKSSQLTREARLARLSKADRKPTSQNIIVKKFNRNPDVVAEVLYLADGICGQCKNKAPFVKRDGNEPYLEVHHIVPLSKGGDDTVENCIALCPNCHREAHYG